MSAATTQSESEVAGGTRERILAAAASVLSRKGYAGTRLSDIAELAGLRTPAVYYYFDSREALIQEVMMEGQQRVLEYVSLAVSELGDAPALERLDRAVEAHLEVELRLSDFATAVTRNAGQLPQELRDSFRARGHRYLELWDRILDDLAAESALNPRLDRRAARMFVLGALNWTAEWWDAGHGSLGELVSTAQVMVRQGLLPT